MVAIFIIAFYLIIPLIFLGMQPFKLPWRVYWLTAVVSNLVLWTALFFLRLQLPAAVPLATWETLAGDSQWFNETSLLLDTTSWAFGFALASLCLGGILTDLARPGEGNRATWAAVTGLTGLGVLAVFSGNLLTMLLAWLLIDFTELVILSQGNLVTPTRKRVVFNIYARFTGSFIVIAGLVFSSSRGNGYTNYENLSPLINLFLLSAAAFRSGLLPFFTPRFREKATPRTLGNSLRWITTASSLILITRIADQGIISGWLDIFCLVIGIVAVYSALRWFSAEDEVSGRFYWLAAMSSLAIVSAAKAQPTASLAWSLAALLPGGTLMMASKRNRLTLPLAIASTVFISTLPFTPTWNGLLLYAPPYQAGLVLILLAQTALLAGFARHFFTPIEPAEKQDPWENAVYLWGLIILPVTYLAASYWSQLIWPGPALDLLLPLAGVALLAGGMVVWRQRRYHISDRWSTAGNQIFNARWLLLPGAAMYRSARRITEFVSTIFEGQGGVLWSILILVLLLSVLVSVNAGR